MKRTLSLPNGNLKTLKHENQDFRRKKYLKEFCCLTNMDPLLQDIVRENPGFVNYYRTQNICPQEEYETMIKVNISGNNGRQPS